MTVGVHHVFGFRSEAKPSEDPRRTLQSFLRPPPIALKIGTMAPEAATGDIEMSSSYAEEVQPVQVVFDIGST